METAHVPVYTNDKNPECKNQVTSYLSFYKSKTLCFYLSVFQF